MKALVSVCMLTYNHENYIKQAIESVLNQKTDFNIELVIGEDNSTDATRIICEKYADRYPHLIKLQPCQGKNIGPHYNFIRTFEACTGKYIAMLEGDDFWTDELKIQKQIEFLENNPDYALCSHAFNVVTIDNNVLKVPTADLELMYPKGFDITLLNFFERWYTKTLTTVFRRDAVNFDFKSYTFISDTVLYFHILLKNKGFWMNVNAGSYRVHGTSMWSSLKTKQSLWMSLSTYSELYKHNKYIRPLQAAYLLKLRQLIEYIMHPDNRSELKFKELLNSCLTYINISSEKFEAGLYLKRMVLEILILRFKIKIRKSLNIYHAN
jgi:glycosyltransferase involved in cell wall biosynthesis